MDGKIGTINLKPVCNTLLETKFLRLNYTNINKNTYTQNWIIKDIMVRWFLKTEKCYIFEEKW